MASSAYTTLDGMVVNTKAAAVYAAFERSLFLSGALVPTISVPAGSYVAQVPFLDGTITVDEAGVGADFATEEVTASNVDATKLEVRAKTYAARTVLRAIGGVNPEEIGAVLGNKISNAYDADVMTALLLAAYDAVTQPTGNVPVATGGALTMDNLFEAASKIREQGETGTLSAVVSPTMAYQLMTNVQSTGFAGGDYQTEALRNGFVTQAAGINIFQSSHATGDGVVFGADAARQAMFKGMDITITDAPTKVGMDVVGSLHQGVKLIDAKRATVLTVA